MYRNAIAEPLQRYQCVRRILLGLLVASWGSAAMGDEIQTKDGRTIVGTVRASKEKMLVVELAPGNMVLVKQDDVKLHRKSTSEQEYANSVKEPADTVEFHLRQAGVAKKLGLPEHERAHWQRAIELDPENATARSGLGYKLEDGRWVQRDKLMTEGRGKVSVGGRRYRFPELIAIEEAQAKAALERTKLAGELRKALANLSNPRINADAKARAQATIDNLDGPYASGAIFDLLFPKVAGMRKEVASIELKLMFVPILARLGDAGAVQTLIKFALTPEENDAVRVGQLRERSVAVLKELAPDAALAAFLGELNSSEPAVVNVAGYALNELGDPRAVERLIDRVRTFKRETITAGSGGNTQAGMVNGNATFKYGPDPVQKVDVPYDNVGVHLALTSLTDVDFQYDRNAWLAWYEAEHGTFHGDLRRD